MTCHLLSVVDAIPTRLDMELIVSLSTFPRFTCSLQSASIPFGLRSILTMPRHAQEEAEEEVVTELPSHSLDFKEKLVEKGKRESTDALLRKLKVSCTHPPLAVGLQSSSKSCVTVIADQPDSSLQAQCPRSRYSGRCFASSSEETTHQRSHPPPQRVSCPN